MQLHYSLSITEIIFIIVFASAYLVYSIRMYWIGKQLCTGTSRIILKLLIRGIYFSLFIVALLGPTFGTAKREVQSKGKDIYVAVDLSESMNAFDVQPTRLEKIKFELKKIVEAFNSDRIGLIIFSSEAFVQCPLTYDQSALNLFIDGLNTGLVPRAGTDFGPPLQMALNKINDDESPVNQQNSKIIILISDGEDFGDNTSGISAEIEESGIKLFTLGIGTDKGSKILTRKGFKKDNSGGEVITQLNPKSLKKLAVQTGGKYFEISNESNDVSRLINTINDIEGELRESKKLDVAENKYFYFLLIAAGLLALDMLLTVKVLKV
ncbi:MAG: VWA domain-containing protein [Bacteroidota bacterium]